MIKDIYYRVVSLAIIGSVCISLLSSLSAEQYRKLDPVRNGEANPYGLDIWEEDFTPTGYTKHNRWGVYQAKAKAENVVFRNQSTPATIHSANSGFDSIADRYEVVFKGIKFPRDELILTKSLGDIGREGETWWSGTSGKEGPAKSLTFDVPDSNATYYLLRKLHFRTDERVLSNELQGGQALAKGKKKLIVLIHGWNPDKLADFYEEGENFKALSTQLKNKLSNQNEWALVQYRWEKDSASGSNSIFAEGVHVETNGFEAAEVGHTHGVHLGQLLSSRIGGLEKVHFIAHSAGAWVARSAATYIALNASSSRQANLEIQLTFLDPYIPGANKKLETKLTPDKISSLFGPSAQDHYLTCGEVSAYRLENYYARDISDIKNGATSQQFEWNRDAGDRAKELRTDHTFSKAIMMAGPGGAFSDDNTYYDGHGGPIVFYTDSILGKLKKPTSQYELSDPEYKAWEDDAIGWKNSLFYQQPPPAGIRLPPKEPLGDDIYQVPYARSNLPAGEFGGTCVEFVQKARPELNYGWAEASNAATRARQEGFEVNSLPRVGAVFIDPARVGPYVGHVGIVTAVNQAQIKGRKYYRLLVDDSDSATYQKIRRDVMVWLRVDAVGKAIFDPSMRRDGERFPLYTRGERPQSGPERELLFIHEKSEIYNRKRQELAGFYGLSNDGKVDQVMALRRNLVFYLVDRSGSMKGEGGSLDLRDEVRQRIFDHASQLPPNTQVELQFFNSSAGAVKDWHPFKEPTLAQFKTYFDREFNPDGGTRLFDTVYEAMESLRKQGQSLNQIEFIIYSDGDDNESSQQAKSQRWNIISPAIAQLRQSNHFFRSYLFTMGYELAAQDLETLQEMGVEVTAVAVEVAQENLERFDRITLNDGSRYHGKLLAKELKFDTDYGSSLVPLREIVVYENGKLETKDGITKTAELSEGELKINTGEKLIVLPASSITSIRTANQ